MKIVELKPKLDCHDIAKGLRNIADDIEGGKYAFDPTLAVVVLGVESEKRDRDGITASFNWQTHGLGDACYFAIKGLLGCSLSRFELGGEN